MPYVPINLILEQRLTPNAMLNLPYPVGKTEGSFFGTFNHTIAVNERFFRSPADFLVVPQADRIVLHWRSNIMIEKGMLIHIQLEEMGTDFYFDQRTGVTVQGMVPSNLFMVNLRTPLSENPQYFCQPTYISSAGVIPLITHQPDVPRNVTIHSTEDDSNRVFRIEGEDPYQRTMIEEVVGPNKNTVEGNKAFAKITRIIVSGACQGEMTIGAGRRLGLPMFLPAAGYLLREIFNGESITGGTATNGDIGIPNPNSGDRRGTYTPPASAVLDGRRALHVLVSLPNPGNIGSPDYAG